MQPHFIPPSSLNPRARLGLETIHRDGPIEAVLHSIPVRAKLTGRLVQHKTTWWETGIALSNGHERNRTGSPEHVDGIGPGGEINGCR